MSKIVLVVDEFAHIREMMRFFIEDSGYSVIEAADSCEALEKSELYHPDLILMDISLPIMDDFTLMSVIRDKEKLKQVKIVAIAGYENISLDKLVESGFDDILHKPIHFDHLEPVLNQYLEN